MPPKKCLLLFFILMLAIFLGEYAVALPVNFSRPQDPLTYQEIKSKHFYLYYDKAAASEAQGLIRSLEAARAPLHRWLRVERDTPQPVVVSAHTSQASFANFLTDALEIQSMGQGGRDLVWHELTHSSMYRHLDNILGHAGSIIHLPFMPAWWIEGLAEALSMSLGGVHQAGLERFFSLNQQGRDFPSYDKLHSLYGKGEFGYVGYGISGSFVLYLLQTYDPERLPQLLTDFRDYSMPWWWPATVIPFTNFMPMDRVLIQWTGKAGEELYEDYKKAARAYWSSQLTSQSSEEWQDLGHQSFRSQIYQLSQSDETIWAIKSDGDSKYDMSWTTASAKSTRSKQGTRQLLPKAEILSTRFHGPKIHAYLTADIDDDLNWLTKIHVSRKSDILGAVHYRTKGDVTQIKIHRNRMFWLEQRGDQSMLCLKPLQSTARVTCPMVRRQPQSLSWLGSSADEIWLGDKVETFAGDRYQLIQLELNSIRVTSMNLPQGGAPQSWLSLHGKNYLLVHGHSFSFVREMGSDGQCQRDWVLPLAGEGLLNDQGRVVVALKEVDGYRFINVEDYPALGRCQMLSPQRSPLIYAQINPGASLKEAVTFASHWRESDVSRYSQLQAMINKAPPTSQAIPQDQTEADFRSGEAAQFRARPLFAFPWIGADGLGNTFGFRSIPLMDHMQNHTIQMSLLYGSESRFPSIDINYENSKHKTHQSYSSFNRQTFNGVYQQDILYYRETGMSADYSRYFPISQIQLSYGLSSAYFKPIIGPPLFNIEGWEHRFLGSLAKSWRLGEFGLSQSLGAEVVPEQINKTWDYNQLRSSTQLYRSFSLFSRSNRMTLGLSGSRTRGSHMKYLREVYRPLKTFVPGDGGGINGTNFSLLGDGYLTSAIYGDNQVRSNLSYTIPLVPDFETLFGIFYLQSLDFTAFVNYGTAWSDQFDPADLVLAHGYNFDLSTDIKGVKVNIGLGVGQVVEHNWEVYFKFGFDTLVDIES